MSRKTKKHPHPPKSHTRLWVRIVAIGCAVLMLGTAIPVGIWLALASL